MSIRPETESQLERALRSYSEKYRNEFAAPVAQPIPSKFEIGSVQESNALEEFALQQLKKMGY